MEADDKGEPQACPEHSSEAVGQLMIEQGFEHDPAPRALLYQIRES